jgi:peptidoglycan/xylan/chitin deacetylase (PgdA/CDA1 family)
LAGEKFKVMSHISLRTLTLLAGTLLMLSCGAQAAVGSGAVEFVGKTKYLNNARAVVAHSMDDSTKYVPRAIDALDKYGVKATIFISTDADPAPEERFLTQLLVRELWPRLNRAVADGHEIGSHSQTHPCKNPDTESFCSDAYSDAEVVGSRDQILKHTKQPYVWTWCYPCGHCAKYDFIQKRIKAAGYIVARNYPDESHDGHILPNLQTWADNPYNAAYTQVVQKRGGAAKSERLDMGQLNGKFDEIYRKGGIYNFMSHPQWLDFGPDGFYEKHLAHISRKVDVWYVPMGPLYAYKTIYDSTEVQPIAGGPGRSVFTVSNHLDPRVYSGSLTLEFRAPEHLEILSNGKRLSERPAGPTERWNEEYFRRDHEHLYVTVSSRTRLEFRPISRLQAGEFAGVWNASYVTEEGQTRESTLTLVVDGNNVTGAIVGPRGHAKIEGGEIHGSKISFFVIRKSNYDEVKINFAGVLKGDQLTLKMQLGARAPVSLVATRKG